MALRDELQVVFDRYVAAYQAGDAPGCAAVFLPEAVMMSPYGPTASGHGAIAAQHAEWVGHGGGGKRLEIVAHGGAGDLAWALAAFSEGAATGEGMSLNVFERQGDGRWLIRMSSLNAGAAPVL